MEEPSRFETYACPGGEGVALAGVWELAENGDVSLLDSAVCQMNRNQPRLCVLLLLVGAVVGCGDATARLRSGDRVRVDGMHGVVEILEAVGEQE